MPGIRWGRIVECSGEDPYLGSRIAEAMVHGFQGDDLLAENTILSCAKHYAAYDASQVGRDYNTVDISERVLREIYLPSFKATCKAGDTTFMTSFNDYDGTPCTANDFLLNDILKGEWKFKGFVITDHSSIREMIAHG